MTVEKAIYHFIVAHKIENCTPRTLKWYEQSLGYFKDWVERVHHISDVEQLELVHLREWIGYLQETPIRTGGKRSDQTILGLARALLAFCHWLEKEGVLKKPISAHFRLPRVEQKFIPTFTSQEVELLFAACDSGDTRKWREKLTKTMAARNRAILAVFLDTGIRVKELVGLRLGDIDRERRLLLIHRKGNWWQQVPISWDGFKPLHEYLTKHRPYLASRAADKDDTKVRRPAHKDDPVFLTSSGKPVKIGTVEWLFDVLEKRTGIEGKRIAPHNCRRYMATTQLASGRSPFDVQRQLGHKTLTMTNRYASLTVEQLQQSHDLHSPLRAKHGGEKQDALGTGYWDIE